MTRAQVTGLSHRLRSLLPLATALLALPLRVTLTALEWVVADVLARLLALPVLLVFQARWHVVHAYVQVERRIKLEHACTATLILEANVAARARHFEEVMAAIDRVDRAYAFFEPLCDESRETARAAYEAEMQRLEEIALDEPLGERIARKIDVIIDGKYPAP